MLALTTWWWQFGMCARVRHMCETYGGMLVENKLLAPGQRKARKPSQHVGPLTPPSLPGIPHYPWFIAALCFDSEVLPVPHAWANQMTSSLGGTRTCFALTALD